MTVWLAQCLCPDRHTVLALAGEAVDREQAEREIAAPFRATLDDVIHLQLVNPWCSLCHAPRERWIFELERTLFDTLEAAAPHLQRLEAEQAQVRAMWGDIKRND